MPRALVPLGFQKFRDMGVVTSARFILCWTCGAGNLAETVYDRYVHAA